MSDSFNPNDYSITSSLTGATGTSSAWGTIGGPVYTIGTSANISISPWITTDYTNISNIGNSGKLSLTGENADIDINGRSLMDAISALEQRLNIMIPNPELEAEWDELRELGDRYRELEKQCKEKGRMWSNLKEIKK